MLVKFSMDFDEFRLDLDVDEELDSVALQFRNIADAWVEAGILYVYQTSFEMLRHPTIARRDALRQKNFVAELKNILVSNRARIQFSNDAYRDKYIELIESVQQSPSNNADGIDLFGVTPSYFEQSIAPRTTRSKFIASNVEVTRNSDIASSQTFISARKTRDFQVPRGLQPPEIWQKFNFSRFLKYNSALAVVDRIEISEESIATLENSGLFFFVEQLAETPDRGVVDLYLRVRGSARNRHRYFSKLDKKLTQLDVKRLSIHAVEDDDVFKDYPHWRYFRGGQAVYICERGLSIFNRAARPFDLALVPSYANVDWPRYEGTIRDYARLAYSTI